MRLRVPLLLLLLATASAIAAAETLSSRMVHRLSDEARLQAGSRGGRWPRRGSGEYFHALVRSDLQRQKRRVGGKFQLLSLSRGGQIFTFGNDFGWCATSHLVLRDSNLFLLLQFTVNAYFLSPILQCYCSRLKQ
jgi:hypothetical protein